jgi:arylsulfatase A-like enzyme
MKAFRCVLLLTRLCLLAFGFGHARAANNILLLIADDLGADSFPLTATVGASLPPMPNIAALKNSGVLFRNAHSHPTCSPTRASILTGRHPFRTGIGAQLTGATSPQLQASEFTLPEAFAANSELGYSLAMFGKWHLNSGAGTNDTPRTIGGWPHFAGTITGALPDYSSWTKITNGVSTATTNYATTDTADDLIAWITSRPVGTPWFAWAAFHSPHAPLHVPPAGLHTYGTPTTNRTQYEAMCQALDTEVGRVLANVNLATTNVIFLGDNGTPQNVIQTPYNAAHSKETLYEGGTRVPMIIAGPAVVSPNRDSSVPVNCADLYATVLELAGIDVTATQPAANPIDAKSLLPILKNTTDIERTAFSQMFSSELATSVSGRVVTDSAGYSIIQFDDGHEEFFYTPTDANQTTNLLGTSITTAAQSAYAALKLKLSDFTASGVPNEALVTSWFTANSGEYARIYPTVTDMLNQNSVTTWSRGAGTQSSPTYAGVHQVDFSTSWVYIHTTGLGSHIMGPWYLNAAQTNLFPNYPSNTAVTYRLPRVPAAIPATKTLTGLGAIGYFVDGIAMFDTRDGMYWNGTAEANGSGYWNRDAYVNEGVTFDNAGAHQAQNNHHYHASPRALRHLLGDHVDHTPATNTYTENATSLHHSPILGWMADGLPLYGPYGYSDPLDAGSGIRRMISGFALRNGQNGTDNLTSTGRTTIPGWAQRAYNVAANILAGPPVNTTYPLGRYLEDNAYRGDLGQTLGVDFDLNEYNARYCVTPEFPTGTWAYFICIANNGTPVFPYHVGRAYCGSPTGGAVTAISEPVATSFVGGPFVADSPQSITWAPASGDVTFTWSGVEGGTYRVDASNDLAAWNTVAPSVTATGDNQVGIVESGAATSFPKRFYRVERTALATYDKTGFAGTYFTSSAPVGGGPNTVTPNTGNRGSAVSVVIELPLPLPPANVGVNSITFGSGSGITVSGILRYSQTLITASFTIAAGATTGGRNVTVTYNGGVTRTITNGFTVQ